jgi:hypothetical protein
VELESQESSGETEHLIEHLTLQLQQERTSSEEAVFAN